MMNTKNNEGTVTDTQIPPTKREDDFIVNPYHPNDFDLRRWFYREDIIKTIKNTFKNHPENKFIIIQGSPGTGKTSTLKHIESSPGKRKKEKHTEQKPGENYIHIYLDSRNCIGLNTDKLMFYAYKMIYDKLKELGHITPPFEPDEKPGMEGYTVQAYILKIDGYLEEDDVLVLILDEFDNLLENIDSQFVSDVIRFLNYMAKSWNRYGLIIATDKNLHQITNDETINQFLEKASRVDIDGYLEETVSENHITEPLRGKITYDRDAIREIIWYSGRHVYFQELICYYIVNLLIEENKHHCSKKDVEKAVQCILNDSEGNKRPEFAFIWENKMPVETRILASALMDESITEKRNNSYILKENDLLENIFQGGIHNKITEFPGSGYFNQMEGKIFPGFPLKVPLLGLWIQKEHPFIKTIIEHMEFIADKINMDLITAEIKRVPSNKLPPFGREAILAISNNWRLLEDSITLTPQKSVKSHNEGFRQGLSELLNLSIMESKSNGNYFVMDIKNLNIGILIEAFCFIQDRPEIKEKDIFNIENIATAVAQDTKTQLTLYFYLHKSSLVEELVEKTYLNLIPIDSIDLKKIVFSNRPRDTTRNMILGKLSLQTVSPYQTAGPARVTFYGRSNTIRQITREANTSYAIVGARKIGKTSLLHKIIENPPPNTDYIFMNLDPLFKGASTYRPFLQCLEEEIEKISKKKVKIYRFKIEKSLSRLSDVIKRLSKEGRRIIFVFDEADALIKFDGEHQYQLLHNFRTMSQHNYSQFIFAGFKTLYHRKREIDNPLYNFCTEIMLEPLDRNAALDLITKPMESIGVHYQDNEDRELILEYTACHPNLLQFFCVQLIEKIEHHKNMEERRIIFRNDIQKLFNRAYEKYIMDEVYMFYSDLTNMNRLILVLLVEEQSKQSEEITFSLPKIKNKLMEQGIEVPIDKLYRDLKNLVMRFILKETESDNYSFALPVFPRILGKRIDNDFKKSLISETKKEIEIDSKSI
jgi:Cdc6-like AAA superfamily ATPase